MSETTPSQEPQEQPQPHVPFSKAQRRAWLAQIGILPTDESPKGIPENLLE